MRLEANGATGYGEAAPSGSVTGESLAAALEAIEAWRTDEDALERELNAATYVPGGTMTPAARNGLVAARLDATGRQEGVPLHRLLNIPGGTIESSITISLGPPEAALAQADAHDQAGWSLFKVKLGGPDDEAVMRALRDRYPEKRIRVDANEAWTPQVASERLVLLERLNVEFVEQPLPRDQLEASAALARRFEIPVVLDESLRDTESALELIRHDAADGGNIKLNKCGGALEARRMVKLLRGHGWRVMMGCNLESRLGIAAAAAFAGVVDYADLDGHELLAEDPFVGFDTPRGRVVTPDRPGIGVDPGPGFVAKPSTP